MNGRFNAPGLVLTHDDSSDGCTVGQVFFYPTHIPQDLADRTVFGPTGFELDDDPVVSRVSAEEIYSPDVAGSGARPLSITFRFLARGFQL